MLEPPEQELDSSMEPDPDLRAIALVRRGELDAFEEIVTRHGPAVLGLARALLADPGDRDDLCQEVFVAAFRFLDQFDPRKGSLRAWLLTIARNLGKNLLKRRIRESSHRPPAMENRIATPDKIASEREAFERLDREFERLPEKLRVAFALVEVHGLALSEAARIEAVPVGTIKSRVARARERLRELCVESTS